MTGYGNDSAGALAAQLANGDWTALEGAVIDPEWLRYYSMRGMLIRFNKAAIDERQCQRFAIVDTAGTSKQKAAERKGKEASWSVCSVWDYHKPADILFLRYVWRKRASWSELKAGVADTLEAWGNPVCIVENAHHGPVLAKELRTKTDLINPVLPGMGGVRIAAGKGSDEKADNAKYDRFVASGALNRFEDGQVMLPDVGAVPTAAGWMPEVESELLGFTGDPDQPADIVDNCSYASHRVRSRRGRWGGVIGKNEVSRARLW